MYTISYVICHFLIQINKKSVHSWFSIPSQVLNRRAPDPHLKYLRIEIILASNHYELVQSIKTKLYVFLWYKINDIGVRNLIDILHLIWIIGDYLYDDKGNKYDFLK